MKKYISMWCCLCLAVIMAAGLVSCSIYGERKTTAESYLDVRKHALLSSRPDGYEDFTVYAAIVDMDAGDHVRTLVCFADGGTSCYASTGEILLSSEQSSPAVAQATQAFLKGSGELLDATVKVLQTDLPLPGENEHTVYLLTDEGLYTLTVVADKLDASHEKIKALVALYTAVNQAVEALGAAEAVS